MRGCRELKDIFQQEMINVYVITKDGVCVFESPDGKQHVGHFLNRQVIESHESHQDKKSAVRAFATILEKKLDTGKFPWEEE